MAFTEDYLKVADYSIDCKSVPFVTFLNSCAITLGPLKVGGVAFYSIKTDGNNFCTFGLIARAVAWESGDPATMQVCFEPEYPIYAANSGTFQPNPDPVAFPPADATKIFSQSWDVVWPDLNKFNKVAGVGVSAAPEFELCYIDISPFCKMAGIKMKADGTFVMLHDAGEPDEYYELPYPIPSARGFRLSRASIDFDYTKYDGTTRTPIELGKVRTLKFNPHPEPELKPIAARPAVAYELGHACPPIWYDESQSAILRAITAQSLEAKLLNAEPDLPPNPPLEVEESDTFFDRFKKDSTIRSLVLALLLLLLGLLYSVFGE